MLDINLTQPELLTLDQMIDEMVNSKVRSESEKAFQKDVCDRAKEELSVPPKTLKALVSERYEKKVSTEVEEKSEIVSIHESIELARKNNTKP